MHCFALHVDTFSLCVYASLSPLCLSVCLSLLQHICTHEIHNRVLCIIFLNQGFASAAPVTPNVSSSYLTVIDLFHSIYPPP